MRQDGVILINAHHPAPRPNRFAATRYEIMASFLSYSSPIPALSSTAVGTL